MNNLGARLLEARRKAGLSQSEVARRAGIERSYLHRLEKGERTNPSIRIWTRLCHILDMPVWQEGDIT
jgi:transcriptional regulator with XRE-family HTH domain